jgi:hypothetical protein
VRGDPDDLLLLAGDGFATDDVVVYEAISDTTAPLRTIAAVPERSTAEAGVAQIVSVSNVPHSLTIRLPLALRSGQSYALWVRNRDQEWSNGIRINDARPLWLSPAFVYASEPLASLPRRLKVVGRNLRPAPGKVTRVRLTGARLLTLEAMANGDSRGAIARYVAEVDLPPKLESGKYAVSVSRDGVSWVALEGQALTVKPDAPAVREFGVNAAEYGGCRGDDEADDGSCIVRAVAAARSSGGGIIVFGPGQWHLIDSAGNATATDGIVVPQGISLRGAGSSLTTIVRGSRWGGPNSRGQGDGLPLFTLLGENAVDGFRFKDDRKYSADDVGAAGPILRLGSRWAQVNSAHRNDPSVVADVIISRNVFDKPAVAISSGGLPIERLFVTYNEFGAFKDGINLAGDRYNVRQVFRIDDSVFAYNVFRPGSYMDVGARQGSIASHLGASRHVDFSHNLADGASAIYLNDPATDPRGWRAAHFWNLNGNHEMLLVSQNRMTCTGDKTGDGEAIAYDNNGNTFAFDAARTALAATASTVTVRGPLKARQNNRAIDTAGYYIGHWIQIAEGPGLGQTRRIVSYQADAGETVTFTVSPRWDVPPRPLVSRLTVAQTFWQVYTIDNVVDHRAVVDGVPLCLKTNRSTKLGADMGAGTIALWAQTADSIVEGNRQYETTGIWLQHLYKAEDPKQCPDCQSGTAFQAFVEIRGNTIDHEYDWNSDCSRSGIYGSHGASPTPNEPPPVAGYGVAIARNHIVRADGLRGGAITIPLSWHGGPPPGKWKLLNNTLIHHNLIEEMAGPVPSRACDQPQSARIGIHVGSPLVWNSVLYANRCRNVPVPLVDAGSNTQQVCPSPAGDSCECGKL